ncbi:MAG: DUF1801 domain-containing protein [Flavobacteriales bacterium]
MKLAKSVEEYFESNSEKREELEKLRSILQRTELQEELKWGAPYYTLNNKQVVGMAAFKHYTGLWFTNGVFLKDPNKVLMSASEGITRGLRQWRFNSVYEMDEDLIHAYILEAIENQKAGKEIKPQKKKLVIPEELSQALLSDRKLKLAFDALTQGKQIEYADYIGTAKLDDTRITRLRKCLPLILNGKGLNDKYR